MVKMPKCSTMIDETKQGDQDLKARIKELVKKSTQKHLPPAIAQSEWKAKESIQCLVCQVSEVLSPRGRVAK